MADRHPSARCSSAVARVLRTAAVHLHSLAEQDRDAGHVAPGFREAMVKWAELGLPGSKNAAAAARALSPEGAPRRRKARRRG